jgi:hypothetical protein
MYSEKEIHIDILFVHPFHVAFKCNFLMHMIHVRCQRIRASARLLVQVKASSSNPLQKIIALVLRRSLIKICRNIVELLSSFT